MPDIGSLLKSEIRRLAKKEARFATAHAQRRVAQHRRDIAKLKRVIQDQALRISRLEAAEKSPVLGEVAADVPEDARFSARSVRAQRKRLGLSAELYGKLVGVTGQTVYAWEQKQSRPRQTQLAAWYASRKLTRAEAIDRLGGPIVKKKPGPKPGSKRKKRSGKVAAKRSSKSVKRR